MTTGLLYAASADFQAARQLSGLAPGHPALKLHGHGFTASVRARLPSGWQGFPGAEADNLRDRLLTCVAALDYEFLNHLMPNPDDEALARWVAAHLDVPDLCLSGVRSTPLQGVELDAGQRAHVWRRYRFEAAHRLPNVPEGHQCGRMHGHGFDVILHATKDAEGSVDGLDYARLDRAWEGIFAQLDHACLNTIEGLDNPTSEVLCAWMWDRLVQQLPGLTRVTVYETATAGCHYDGEHYRIWKEQRFEAALSLPAAPAHDRRHRLHGHSYLLRLHLSAPLDPVMGWTVDYGDVKALFKPVYQRIDHHRLNDIESLQSVAPADLAAWIYQRAHAVLPQVDRVDLYQTPGCGVIFKRFDASSAGVAA